jgi:hypothetical protein
VNAIFWCFLINSIKLMIRSKNSQIFLNVSFHLLQNKQVRAK